MQNRADMDIQWRWLLIGQKLRQARILGEIEDLKDIREYSDPVARVALFSKASVVSKHEERGHASHPTLRL
jgi:hypothetical protein